APRFDLTLPQNVILTHTAFVAVTFSSWNDCRITNDGGISYVTPELVYGDTTLCDPCQDFNYYNDAGGPNFVDYCSAYNSPNHNFRLGPPVLYASGTCGQY